MLLESLTARRGLIAIYFTIACVLSISTWLRPPLSPDIRAHHIPWSIAGRSAADADQVLAVPRSLRLDSIGVVLLCVIATGCAISCVRPRHLVGVAALLLCVSIVGNAILCLNYPSLIEQLRGEGEQRQQIARVLVSLNPDSLSNGGEPRVASSADTPRVLRGVDYLLYGPWLVVWSAIGVLFAARGSLGRRLVWIALCFGAATLASAALCIPRLYAEFYVAKAEWLDDRCEFESARLCLDKVLSACPELQQTADVRTLRGKLDFRVNRPSLDQTLWTMDQYVRHGQGAKAAAMADRMTVNPENQFVSRFVAQLFNQVGLDYWAQGRWIAAAQMWRRAVDLDANRWDSRYLLGAVQAAMDRSRPQLVDAELQPLVGRIADRILRADILASIGDAYFDAGELVTARRYYEDSLRAFELPKEINYRARKGLIGM